MTNFEKILHSTTREDMADALSACFEGQCDECPALALCNQMGDQEEVGCTDVMLRWLDQEAEPMPEAPREAGGILYPLGNGGRVG